MNTRSDIFSFGIVVSHGDPLMNLAFHCQHLLNSGLQCIYAVHKRIIFAVDESELGEGEEILAHVLERQISYFADADGIQGFLENIRESPYAEIFRVIRDGFGKENPRRPFALWKGVDPVFKDLVCRTTAFNPPNRITAREALAHPWFGGV